MMNDELKSILKKKRNPLSFFEIEEFDVVNNFRKKMYEKNGSKV